MVARVHIRPPYTDLDAPRKLGSAFKIRGRIPISAARESVGGVWPRAKYSCCSALRGQKPGPFFLVQVLWHLQLTYR